LTLPLSTSSTVISEAIALPTFLTPEGVLDPATAPIPGDSLGNREPRSLVAAAVRLLPLDLLTKQFELLVTPRALLAQESDLFLARGSRRGRPDLASR
jgi:hypothetical protein